MDGQGSTMSFLPASRTLRYPVRAARITGL
jgi:hypothetical protein